jgi:UDP-glucose:(heptosyl)LPS alpha-1,3-glucosyltransferase
MRVAFVIDRYRSRKGGLEAWLSGFGRCLREAGHELHLVSRRGDVPPEGFNAAGIRTRGLTRSGRDRAFAEQARDLTDDAGFDTVVGLRHCLSCHVYYPHGGSVGATWEAHRGKTHGGGRPTAKWRTLLDLEAELLSGPEAPRAVVAVSKMVASDLASRYPAVAGRIEVVPNGVDLARFTPPTSPNRRRPGRTVAFIAGNPKLKGIDVALEVYRRLRHADDADLLVVAGGHPGPLPDGAIFRGATDRPEEILQSADLLLYPTRYDPFPLIVLESLACGTPVATTEQNGALDHTGRDGPVRAVADPGDVYALTEIARTLLREAPRDAAREVAERFPVGESYAAAAAIVTCADGSGSAVGQAE